ncbi:MAG: UDP-N-acetylmuramoyl-L-alanyl-D-glutamate--2,6-diaminopimelate ligase [Planctomycetota bacterium]
MRLEELVQGLRITVVSEPSPARVCDVTEDSRTVLPGSLFIARAGLKADGRRYIADAIESGACAVMTDASVSADQLPQSARTVALLHSDDISRSTAGIAERFYGAPSSQLQVVGITGTNGKTTTAHLTHRLLNASGVRAGLIGTVYIDDGSEIARAAMTTPPALELSQTLSTMVESGCRAAVLEVSSHALAQHRVGAVDFDVAIFTNLSGDHLDYHQDMESYAAAKAMLFEGLRDSALAVVAAEDPASQRMIRDCSARVLYCTTASADPCSVQWQFAGSDGMAVQLRGPWGDIEANAPILGAHNAMNLLEAIAAAHELGVDAEHLQRAVSLVEMPPGRLEPIGQPGPARPFRIYVDYAHTDDALRRALEAARGQVEGEGKLRVVFGCGGERDRSKRPRMGAVASTGADEVIVTSDNPRSESPAAIIDEVLSGVPADRRPSVQVDADREAAIRHAIEDARPGDVVVIAGKGHETYQILPDGQGGVSRRSFDDRLVVRLALRDRGVGVEVGAS